MKNNELLNALKQLRTHSSKRNFNQTVDLIINLKDLNLKNPDHHLQLFVPLSHPTGKKISLCGLVGPEMIDTAKEALDEAINVTDFATFQKDMKKTKKLANTHTYFIAQATIMPKVAQAFGRILGTRGKMPNPKAGCVVPPGANLQALSERLHKTTKVAVKTQPTIQVTVGNEEMKDEDIMDNIMTIYDQVIHHLPSEENNIKNVILKLTMGPPIIVGEETKPKEEQPEKAKKEAVKKAPAEPEKSAKTVETEEASE